MSRLRIAAIAAMTFAGSAAFAANFGELSQARPDRGAAAVVPCPPGCGMPMAMPPGATAPGSMGGPLMLQGYGYNRYPSVPTGAVGRWPTALPMLPVGVQGLPANRQLRWTYGQVNAASDPFNVWGLSTPHMFVPWSTPMSGWANAQIWDWWRTRAGDAGPALPIW